MKNIKKIGGLPQGDSRYAPGFANRSAFGLGSLQSPTLPQRYACLGYDETKCMASQIFKLALLAVLTLIGGGANAQLSLEEAVELAWQQHSLLQQQDIQIQQQEVLKDSRKQLQPTTFTYSWEELDPTFTQGIHSLNVQQNFNLPAVAKSQQNYQAAQVQVAQARKEMTKNDLRRQIARSYQQLSWQQSRQSLQKDLLALFQDFERIASRQAELGEIGQLPILAASRAAALAQLNLQNWQADIEISLANWQLWLPKAQALQGIKDSMLQLMPIDTGKGIANNPALAYYRQQINAQASRKQVVASQLKPQLVTGLQLQMVDGEIPFFGGQIGLSAPLFRKGYKAQLQAVDLAVTQQKEQLNWQEQQLETQRQVALQNIQKLKANIEYYDQKLLPLYEKQIALAKKAYELGELNYNDYLQELLRYTQSQSTYWDNLLAHNLWVVELNYLLNQ
jgi:cobalt-zinc-cadmium resistance protein CzcA